MSRFESRTLVIVLALALLGTIGCGGGGTTKVDQAMEDEWAWLQDSKQTLDRMRAERKALIAQLEAQAESADSDVAAEQAEDETATEAAEPTTTPEELENEIYALSDTFAQKLVAFINNPANAQAVGQPPSERQAAALRLKSSEDMVLAQEYIDKGGDYRRAINIYEETLRVDPENEDVLAALEKATQDRWMSEERFGAAEKGMSDKMVRKLLGQPLPSNVRPYPEKKVVAWFYPTSEDKSAAGVYFNETDNGKLEVYQTKYDAVAGRTDATEGE